MTIIADQAVQPKTEIFPDSWCYIKQLATEMRMSINNRRGCEVFQYDRLNCMVGNGAKIKLFNNTWPAKELDYPEINTVLKEILQEANNNDNVTSAIMEFEQEVESVMMDTLTEFGLRT